MLDAEAWAAPASNVEIASAVGTVVALVEPGAGDGRTAVLARAIAGRGYSAAEVKLIAEEAPFANHYGAHVRLDVVDGIVKESRRLRALLTQRISGEQVAELATSHPEVTPDDFATAGFDSRNNTLFRYAPDAARRARERRIEALAVIEDDGPRRIDDGPADKRLMTLVGGIGGGPSRA